MFRFYTHKNPWYYSVRKSVNKKKSRKVVLAEWNRTILYRSSNKQGLFRIIVKLNIIVSIVSLIRIFVRSYIMMELILLFLYYINLNYATVKWCNELEK